MSKTNNLIKSALFVGIIIISAFIKIPVGPVPIALTFFSVNTISLITDTKIAFLSVLSYILIGLLGLPVFSFGGGVGYILTHSFGYLLGFLIVPVISGALKKKTFFKSNLYLKYILISIINIFCIYLAGSVYAYFLSLIYFDTKVEIFNILYFYVLIFIPGDAFSIFVSSYIAKRLKNVK